jgi:hypothetical protein
MAKSARTMALETLLLELKGVLERIGETYGGIAASDAQEASRAARWAAGDLDWYIKDLDPRRVEDVKRELEEVMKSIYMFGVEYGKYSMSYALSTPYIPR